MIVNLLLRAGIAVGGLLVAKNLGKRIVRNRGSLEETLSELKAELAVFGEILSPDEEGFLMSCLKIAGNQYSDFRSLLKLTDEMLERYESLPDTGREQIEKVFNIWDLAVNNVVVAARDEGTKLLAKSTTETNDIDEYLQQIYLGLYLIGRTEYRIPIEQRSDIFELLRSLHQQCDSDTDRSMATWYVNPDKDARPYYHNRLAAHVGVESLNIDTSFIAYALGVERKSLMFENILNDLHSIEFPT